MTSQHVREKTNRKTDWAREEGNDFNGNNQRHDDARHATWDKELQKAQTMLVETVNDHCTNNKQSKCKGYDDLACDRVEIREQTNEVCDKHKHEEREHKGEEFHTL